MEPLMTTLTIDGLNRDVLKKRSIVTLKWEDDPEKRLGRRTRYAALPYAEIARQIHQYVVGRGVHR